MAIIRARTTLLLILTGVAPVAAGCSSPAPAAAPITLTTPTPTAVQPTTTTAAGTTTAAPPTAGSAPITSTRPAYLQPRVPAPSDPVGPALARQPVIDAVQESPAAAREHDPAGRAAFARYFFQVVGRINLGPTTGQLERLCTPTLELCHEREATAREFRAKKLHVDKAQFTVESAVGLPGREARLRLDDEPVQLVLAEHSTRQVDTSGADVAAWTSGERRVTILLGCRWAGDHWLADSYDLLDDLPNGVTTR